MRFCMKVQRQVLGPLALDDFDVFGKDLVVEVERLVDGRFLIEVAAEGDE
jgi:hypothetical protein